ncbi:hypothetical protein M1116_03425 [Patescibacteria group bacterium]|nr:hypothetical protein [Patescibacteria group bacterium]
MTIDTQEQELVRKFFADLFTHYDRLVTENVPGPNCDRELWYEMKCCDKHKALARDWMILCARADGLNALLGINGVRYAVQLDYARRFMAGEETGPNPYSEDKTNVMSIGWYLKLMEVSGIDPLGKPEWLLEAQEKEH